MTSEEKDPLGKPNNLIMLYFDSFCFLLTERFFLSIFFRSVELGTARLWRDWRMLQRSAVPSCEMHLASLNQLMDIQYSF